MVFAIVGNPNCGKSTIFNGLTGLKQKVANYPGVTVERKEGYCYSQHGRRFRLLDLPGAYSMNARSPDEAVVRDVLLGRRADTPLPDAVVFVADASNLERNLYLATQVFELGLPAILVLNMMDVAEEKHWRLDLEKLSQRLGVPVIAMQATAGKGIIELKTAMSRKLDVLPHRPPPIPEEIGRALEQTRSELVAAGVVKKGVSLLEPLYLVSDHDPDHYGINSSHLARLAESRKGLEKRFGGWEESLASARYEAIEDILKDALRRPERDETTLTDKLDAVLLHPLWGGVCFTAVMLLVFYMIFSVAEGPMEWIDKLSGMFGNWIESKMAAGDVRDLLVNGIITGVSGVVKFLPQILILFFFVGLLESTGYMARAAFIMDRPMSKVGLNGRSFIPLLGAYACAIPAIMATRTIENARDRLVTILVAPLMSCSARLPVYLLMIATLLPGDVVPATTKAGIMLAMYALGTGGVFFFAWLFKRTLFKGAPQHMIMELPPYQPPRLGEILRHMIERGWMFLKNAGTIILGISIVLWFLTTYPKHPDPHATPTAQIAQSFAGQAGHLIEPVIKPLGFDWRIGIGLITSFAAREVFVSSMGVIFGVEGAGDDTTPLRDALRGAHWPDGAALFTPLVCIVLMVFYVFAMQCMSTVAVVKRETNSWRWPLFQLAYMTGTAWLVCLVLYQAGRALGY